MTSQPQILLDELDGTSHHGILFVVSIVTKIGVNDEPMAFRNVGRQGEKALA